MHNRIEDRAVEAVDLFIDFPTLDTQRLASAISLCVSSSTEMTSAFRVCSSGLKLDGSVRFRRVDR
jgi:hypothetical protein